MIMLSHGWRCYPTDENIYDLYSGGIIGVIVHGHVINIFMSRHINTPVSSETASNLKRNRFFFKPCG